MDHIKNSYSTLLMMDVFYSGSYCATSVAWDTTRKASFVAASMATDPIVGVRLIEPASTTDDSILGVINQEYLHALKTGEPLHLASSNSIGWDENLLNAVRSSSGGVVDAAMSAVRSGANAGSLSSGLHHARFTRGSGFCTINGLAMAARAVLKETAGRVLVLDLDAHAGGGTASYVGLPGMRGLEQVDVSLIPYDTYSDAPGLCLKMSTASSYIDDVQRALGAVKSPGSFDLVLYNAGMDPHELAGGVVGVSTEMLATREEIVFSWTASHNVPTAWVLAGGYTTSMSMDNLVKLHRLTAKAAAGQ